MTSKKTAKSKRTNSPREFTRTKEFRKDWQRLAYSDRYDMNSLKEVMLLLIENAAPLPHEWLDHPLTGQWKNHRECHIGGDFLLICKLDGSGMDERVVFVRAGTVSHHAKTVFSTSANSSDQHLNKTDSCSESELKLNVPYHLYAFCAG